MDILNSIWALLVRIASDLGEVWQYAAICMLLSMAATQWVKPEMATLLGARRRRAIQAFAFLSAFIPMFALVPNKHGLIIGALIGVLSPMIYKVVVFAIAKRWPDLATALGSDDPEFRVSDFIKERRKPDE